MKVLLFRGFQKTGKTTLMERAVEELSRRGFRVTVIKHSPHLHPEQEQNDTARLLRAGCTEAVLVGARVQVRYTGAGSAAGPESLLAGMRADFVLIEGYRDYRGTLPSIVFGRSADQVQQLKTSSTRAFSGILPDPQQCEQACGLPFVPLDADQSLVADLVEQHAAPTG